MAYTFQRPQTEIALYFEDSEVVAMSAASRDSSVPSQAIATMVSVLKNCESEESAEK